MKFPKAGWWFYFRLFFTMFPAGNCFEGQFKKKKNQVVQKE